MPAWWFDHGLPLLLPRAKWVKSKNNSSQASTAKIYLRMIDNFEHHGGKGYLISGHIEVKFLVVHGIEAASFDTRVRFG